MTICNMHDYLHVRNDSYFTSEYVLLIGLQVIAEGHYTLKLYCHLLALIVTTKAGLDLHQSATTLQPLAFVTTLQKWPDGCKFADRNFHKYWSGRRQENKRTAVMQHRTRMNAHNNVGQRAIMQHKERVLCALLFCYLPSFWLVLELLLLSESTAVNLERF